MSNKVMVFHTSMCLISEAAGKALPNQYAVHFSGLATVKNKYQGLRKSSGSGLNWRKGTKCHSSPSVACQV